MVRPMDDPAFSVPDIFTVEANAVANRESIDARGDVDVVCYQQRLARRKLNDESLVSLPIQVVGQKMNHRAFPFDLYIAGPTRKRTTDGAIVDRRCWAIINRNAFNLDQEGFVRASPNQSS